MKQSANINFWNNGGGLTFDAAVLAEALRSLGWTVFFNGFSMDEPGDPNLVQQVGRRLAWTAARTTRNALYDVNFHLENANGATILLARKNVLVPNQEWVRDETRVQLDSMDLVAAKTKCAEDIFQRLGLNTEFIGWQSRDRRRAHGVGFPETRALHVAGSSLYKGTETILDVWERHQEWPLLTVVRSRSGYGGHALAWMPRQARPNIRVIEERLSESALLHLQNGCRLHIATSEVEGYGHVISEALSIGAVVVCTDAPPMNELVTPDRGLLVDVRETKPVSWGVRHLVDPQSLEIAVERALCLTAEEEDALRQRAREWFVENRMLFRLRLKRALAGLGFDSTFPSTATT